MLKTCLYDGGVLNIRDLVRQGNTDELVMNSITNAIHHRAKDGHEAEKNSAHESMAAIGG
jgi:cyclic pyranopterin phosphate synthase